MITNDSDLGRFVMAIMEVLKYPDERLRKIAVPVTAFDANIRRLVDNMAETMYGASGIGLAATQVDVHKQIIVIDVSEKKNDLRVLINPVLFSAKGEHTLEEGCLSIPAVYAPVTRAETVLVGAATVSGEKYEFEATGLLATCVQHEIDHLQGKVFVDYLSNLKKERIERKLKKSRRE